MLRKDKGTFSDCCKQRKSITEVQEEYRQTWQLTLNLYLKVDDLHLAKLIMSSWNCS